MFRFFRKIRYRLLGEGHLSKYAYYAIGEIFLVVIGILIALQINNWNEERKDNDNIIRILEGVQVDLVNDLREFSLSAEWSRETNELIDRVLASELTKADYSVEEPYSRSLLLLGTRDYHVELSDTSFQSLLSYKDKIPTKYSNIINLLNSMYVEDYAYLNTAQKGLRDFIQRYQYFQFENLPWLMSIDINSLRNRRIPEEGLEYFLNDVRHKQYVRLYERTLASYKQYRDRILQKALYNFLVISDLTESSEALPKIVKKYWKPQESDLSYNVTLERKAANGRLIKFNLSHENGLIISRSIDDESASFYFQQIIMVEESENILRFAFPLSNDESFYKFHRNSSGKIISVDGVVNGIVMVSFDVSE